MRTRPRTSLVAATAVVAVGLAYAASASTLFVPDSDTATLVGILGNGLKQLAALNQQLGQARNTYVATKTLVGYAADAANGFAALVQMDMGRLEQLFITAVPNAGFFDREARWGYKTWGQSTGELQLMIQQCMNFQESKIAAAAQAAGNTPPPPPLPKVPGDVRPIPVVTPYDPCAILQDRLTGREVTLSLARLFPGQNITELGKPALDARGEADKQRVRDLVAQQKLAALRSLCQDAGSADADKCRAATQAAQILSVQQLVELTERMADLSSVEATQLALQASAREQQSMDEEVQRKLLDGAAGQVVPPPLRVQAPGFRFDE